MSIIHYSTTMAIHPEIPGLWQENETVDDKIVKTPKKEKSKTVTKMEQASRLLLTIYH